MGSVAVRPSASAEARGGEAGGAGAGDGYKGSHYEGGGERGRRRARIRGNISKQRAVL